MALKENQKAQNKNINENKIALFISSITVFFMPQPIGEIYPFAMF
jgi:hypothetical protein